MVATETYHPTPQELESAPFSLDMAIYYPGRILSNEEIETWNAKTPGGNPITAESIFKKTGIERRYIAQSHETAQYMAEKAISALDNYHDAQALFLSSSYPTGKNMAEEVIKNLNLSHVKEYAQVGAACSGFVYTLNHIKAHEQDFMGKTVIMATADVYHPTLEDLRNPQRKDESLAQTIFSDGATAMIGRYGEDFTVLSARTIQLLPEYSQSLKMPIDTALQKPPYIGMTVPYTESGFLEQNGKEVYKTVIEHVPYLIAQTVDDANLSPNDITLVIPHQGSKHVVDGIEKRLSDYAGKVKHDYKEGNFSSGSIPKALMDAFARGEIGSGDTFVAAGFGAGMGISIAVVKLDKN